MGGVESVVFDRKGLGNVLFLAKVGKKYRITFDSWGGNKFVVHKPNRKMTVFKQHPCGLYYLDTVIRIVSSSSDDAMAVRDQYERGIKYHLRDAYERGKRKISVFNTTVKDNMKKFTHR